jgi:hypothetical protein
VPISTWLAVRWSIPGELDRDAFAHALSAWVRHHDTLQSWFSVRDGLVHRNVIREIPSFHPQRTEAASRLRDTLESLFSQADPCVWPGWRVVTVTRKDSVTVYFASDHAHIDGYSLLLVPADICELYASALCSRPHSLPPPGSHVVHSAAERQAAGEVTADDPRLARWRRFLDACGGSPRFPLDTGPGGLAPQRAHLAPLISPQAAARLDAACRSARVSVQAGILAVLAIAARELSGCTHYRAVLPWHTRTEATQESLGWFVGPVPLEVATAGSFPEVARAAQYALRAARSCRDIPWTRVTELLGGSYRPVTLEPFSMVSYLDTRGARGFSQWEAQDAAVIGKAYHGDQVYLWVNRTADGISAAWRHPDNPVATASVAAFTHRARLLLKKVSGDT